MKDAVHRIEEKLEEVVEMQADLISQITSSATALADIDARLRKTEAALKEHDAHLTSYARQPKRTA
jgi:septal ring factor EnvC (AmiA/AmiB activator)